MFQVFSRERFQPPREAEWEEAATENERTDELPGAIRLSRAGGLLQHSTSGGALKQRGKPGM